MGDAVQLEVPGGKLRRRRLSRAVEPSVGGAHRVGRRFPGQTGFRGPGPVARQRPLHHDCRARHGGGPASPGSIGLRGADPAGNAKPAGLGAGSGEADRRHRVSESLDAAADLAHPAGLAPARPGENRGLGWVYADKAAPPEVKDAIRLAGVRVFGPSGTFEQDDMDNWQGCTQTARGAVSRSLDLSYGMGLGHERFDPEFGGVASAYRYSESNHRGFYRHWARLMAGERWAELAG